MTSYDRRTASKTVASIARECLKTMDQHGLRLPLRKGASETEQVVELFSATREGRLLMELHYQGSLLAEAKVRMGKVTDLLVDTRTMVSADEWVRIQSAVNGAVDAIEGEPGFKVLVKAAALKDPPNARTLEEFSAWLESTPA